MLDYWKVLYFNMLLPGINILCENKGIHEKSTSLVLGSMNCWVQQRASHTSLVLVSFQFVYANAARKVAGFLMVFQLG